MKSLRPCKVGMFSEELQRQTIDEGNLALFIGTDLVSIYNKNHIPTDSWILEKMVNDAYEEGRKSVANDLKEILNIQEKL